LNPIFRRRHKLSIFSMRFSILTCPQLPDEITAPPLKVDGRSH
jgi:hypothetical protein